METVEQLAKHLETLKIEMHKRKKAHKEKSGGFLHSGEHGVVKFIAKYTSRHEKSPTSVDISNKLGITQATITPLIDKLIEKGLVLRETSSTDKRAKLLSLTEAGMELHNEHKAKFGAELKALADHLGEDDTKNLVRILSKLNTYLSDKHAEKNKCEK